MVEYQEGMNGPLFFKKYKIEKNRVLIRRAFPNCLTGSIIFRSAYEMFFYEQPKFQRFSICIFRVARSQSKPIFGLFCTHVYFINGLFCTHFYYDNGLFCTHWEDLNLINRNLLTIYVCFFNTDCRDLVLFYSPCSILYRNYNKAIHPYLLVKIRYLPNSDVPE